MQSHTTRTVLVIEDNDLVRDVIGAALEADGYETIQVCSGEAALDVLIDGPKLDALVTDINVPGALSGWAIAQWFSALHPGRPVVYASGGAADRTRQVDNSVFIAKPFRPAQLVAAIGALA